MRVLTLAVVASCWSQSARALAFPDRLLRPSSMSGAATSAAGSASAVGAKRKHDELTTADVAAMDTTDQASSNSTSVADASSASKKPRLEVQCLTDVERASLAVSLANQLKQNPAHPGERVCVRSAIDVDASGMPMVHLSIYTPTAATRAAAKEAKFQEQRAFHQNKKAAQKQKEKQRKAAARAEREVLTKQMVAEGKSKEEIDTAMRAHALAANGGKSGRAGPKRCGRTAQQVKREIGEQMRAGTLQRVVIDCAFDHLMRTEEVCSLAKQIRFMYGYNVRSTKPVHMILTSLRLPPGDTALDHYAEITQSLKGRQPAATAHPPPAAYTPQSAPMQDIPTPAAASASASSSSSPPAGPAASPLPSSSPPSFSLRPVLQRMEGFDRLVFDRTTRHYSECFAREELVYLTAESPTVLHRLDPQKVYVIGGIVDHNRLKGLCHQLATHAGIATARLPIPEYLVNDRRTVITVNQGQTKGCEIDACVRVGCFCRLLLTLFRVFLPFLFLVFMFSLRHPPARPRAVRAGLARRVQSRPAGSIQLAGAKRRRQRSRRCADRPKRRSDGSRRERGGPGERRRAGEGAHGHRGTRRRRCARRGRSG